MSTSKTLRDFSVPSADHLPTRLMKEPTDGVELKSGHVNMVQASPFCGKPTEDANAHLVNFVGICSMITIKGATADAIRLRLFPFSLLGKAKQWFYKNQDSMKKWKDCSNAFLAKFFPLGKTNALRNRISGFQQLTDESISDAWE